jgi:2-keto-4-pentenoate hydratase
LDVLVWLANDLSQRGIGLEAGQVVVLGAAAIALMGKELIANFGEASRIEARITSP